MPLRSGSASRWRRSRAGGSGRSPAAGDRHGVAVEILRQAAARPPFRHPSAASLRREGPSQGRMGGTQALVAERPGIGGADRRATETRIVAETSPVPRREKPSFLAPVLFFGSFPNFRRLAGLAKS